jgi:DNA (cytosine-5)-methyltransferase 1
MNYLSVFSGIEATTVAWEPLGFTPLGFSEIEPFPCAVLKYRFPNIENFNDINSFKEFRIGKTIDIMVGGSPCQSFSVAGNRKGIEDERGHLMFTYGNMVNYFKPRWIVWENVPGVLSSNGGKDFLQFLSMLDEYGYGLAWRILDAQYFGVPQRRRRVFIIGYFGDIRRSAAVLFDFGSRKGDITQIATQGGASPGIKGSVNTSIFNQHPADSRIKKSNGVIDTVTGRWGTGGNNTPICLMDQGGSVMQVENNITGTLRKKIMEKANGAGTGEHQHNPIVFRRQFNSKYSKSNISSTLLGEYHDSSMTNLVNSNQLIRKITPREAERLQGFPDDWTKIPYRNKPADKCPDSLRYKAIGNSMAVPVMRWIGERILLTEKIFNEA